MVGLALDRTYLAWNLPNWITVMLMAVAGFLFFAIVAQLLQRAGYKLPTNTLIPSSVTGGGIPGAALIFGGGTQPQ